VVTCRSKKQQGKQQQQQARNNNDTSTPSKYRSTPATHDADDYNIPDTLDLWE
jgi:hypothetical protein